MFLSEFLTSMASGDDILGEGHQKVKITFFLAISPERIDVKVQLDSSCQVAPKSVTPDLLFDCLSVC